MASSSSRPREADVDADDEGIEEEADDADADADEALVAVELFFLALLVALVLFPPCQLDGPAAAIRVSSRLASEVASSLPRRCCFSCCCRFGRMPNLR